ncbi:MAG: PadR family transcriptional regulator [Candidatus Bathyarchaeota archaeon]
MSEGTYWEKSFMLGLSKLIVLSVLRDGPLHGYGIIKEIETRSNQCCSITPGSIYPLLASLKAETLIVDHKETVQGRERTNYELTEKGRGILHEGMEMWEMFINGTRGIFYDDPELEQLEHN